MTRVRVLDRTDGSRASRGGAGQRPIPQRRPIQSRATQYEEEEDEPRPARRLPPRRLEREERRAPLRARQPQYEPEDDGYEKYSDEEAAERYEGEEDDRVVLRRRAQPRTPMHGPQMRGRREAQHEAGHSEPRRTRRRKATAVEDIFYIPVEEIPEGSSYEWKRWAVVGQEDPFYIAQMREQGWEPVDPKRHPSWLPPGYSQPYIIKGGQILMERPIELTEEARAEQKVLARQQVREAEARLGRTPGNTHQRLAPKITKEIMRQVSVEE